MRNFKKITNIFATAILMAVIFLTSCDKQEDLIVKDNPLKELETILDVKTSVVPCPDQGVFTDEELSVIEQKRNEANSLHEKTSLIDGTVNVSGTVSATYSLAGKIIFNNTYAKAEITSGGITFVPNFVFKSVISGGALQSMEAYIENSITANPTLKITVKAALNNSYSAQITKFTKTMGGMIGILPWWVTFEIQIDGGANINGSGVCWISQGITVTSNVKVGGGWTKTGGWYSLGNVPSPSYSITSPSYSYNGNLTVKPYINCFISAKVYSILGPRFLIKPYLNLYLNATTGNRYIDRTVGLLGLVHFDLNGFNLNYTYDKTIFSVSKTFSRYYF
jgi:hypothetical protein